MSDINNPNGSKITILGAGNVGATVAYTFTVAGTCSDIVLVDINDDKAEGEAMDIRQGISFAHNVDIKSGTYEDAAGSTSSSSPSDLPASPVRHVSTSRRQTSISSRR